MGSVGGLENFGRVRSLLWPIHGSEFKKLFPMVLMLFFICFNYSLLRNMKDAIVITAEGSGAEVLPFIKLWALLPMAVLLTWIYTKLCMCFRRDNVFFIMTAGFLVYFLLFAFLIYPSGDLLHPIGFCDTLTELLPKGGKGFIAMIRNWGYTLFYVMAELWSTIVMNVLFWGFANEITRLKQARRFYGVLGVSSCLAAFAAGEAAIFFTYHPLPLTLAHSEWEQTFMSLIILITISGIIVLAAYRWLQLRVIQPNPEYKDWVNDIPSKNKAERKRLSLRECFRYLLTSRYLACIAVMVVGYSLCISLHEISWKSKLKDMMPDPLSFNIYLNQLTAWMGILSAILAFCIPYIISRIGWTFMALITPIIMLVTGLCFFTLLFLQNYDTINVIAAFFTTSPLALIIFFGSANNMLSKTGKYSVFDASKELAFIPLKKQARIQGKAAIDGIGSRLGKSGSSLMQQCLLIIFGTLSACTPWIAGIIVISLVIWLIATISLGKQFKQLSLQEDLANQSLPVLPTSLEGSTAEQPS